MLLLLLSSFDVAGQNDSLSHEDLEPLIPLDTFDTCYGVKAKTGFAVRYDQFAQVFFRTEVPSYNTNFAISSNVNPSLNFDIDTLHYGENEPAELLLKVDQADLDEYFKLFAKSSCGDTLLLNGVSASPTNPKTVQVSKRLFNAIGVNHSDTTLYDILENDSTVLFEEKLSFVQKYFFDDSVFQSYSIASVLDTLPVNGNLTDDVCDCRQINGTSSVEPAVELPFLENGLPYPGGYHLKMFPWVLKNNDRTNFSKWHYIHSISHIGPARYINNFSAGWQTGSKYSEVSVGDVGGTSPTVAFLSFRWSCTVGPYGSLCDEDCQKKVEYSVKFDSRQQANTDLPLCPLCGDKGARARAEEYAALVLTDFDGNFDILDANRAGVASEASKSYSEDWYLDILNFAVDVADILITGNVDYQDLIDNVTQILENLINNDYVVKNGANNQDKSPNILDKSGYFYLSPNTSTELKLLSSAYTEASGHTSWRSNSRIESNYRLSAGMLPGVVDADADFCCSNGLSVWSLASIREAPINYGALFSTVYNFFDLRDLPYSLNDRGYAVESFLCPNPNNGVAPRMSSNMRLSSKLSEIDYYQIFDMNGRLALESFDYDLIDVNTLRISKPHLPGFYFIVAHLRGGDFMSSKFVVMPSQAKNECYVSFK